MAERVIGLDIGSFAIKFVEVELKGSSLTLTKLGQRTLPKGAVVAGEVVDTDLVVATLKELLASAGVHTKRCVVGLGGTRVVVRSLVNPDMSDSELRDAIAFQVIESLPIPASELVSDFERLGTVEADDSRFIRVLLAGAHESVVQRSLEVAKRAGLSVVGVDANSLASARALQCILRESSSKISGDDEATTSQRFAVVEVGSDVTDVVLAGADGVRFVRTLQVGGGEITRRIQEITGCDESTAEWYKRGGHLEEKHIESEIRDGVSLAIREAVEQLTQEVANSLEYYLLQSDDMTIDKVFLGGGAGLIEGLSESLCSRLSLSVELIPTSTYLDLICDEGVSDSDRKLLTVSGLTALGLALWRTPGATKAAHRINLIPKRTAYRESIRKEVSVFVLAALLVGVGMGITSLQANRALDANQSEVDALVAQSSSLQQKIGSLSSVSKLESAVSTLKGEVKSDLQGSISWSSVIAEIATVTPSDSWWTQLQTTQAAVGAPASLTFSLTGCSQQAPKNWLLALSSLSFVQNEWVSSSNLAPAFVSGQACPGYSGGPGLGVEDGVTTFSSTATLPNGFSSNRALKYLNQVVNK